MASAQSAAGSDPFSNAYRGRRVLVTGHSGFKGSWLSIWLLSLGAEVCGYADRVPTSPSLFDAAGLSKRLRHEVGDIRDEARFSAVLQDFRPDFVFHLAAQAIVSTSYANPLETIAVNVMGTAVVLNSLRRVNWPCVAVMITSDKAYHNVEWPWGYRENDRLGGKDIYSGSKGCAELVFTSFFHSFFDREETSVRMATARAGNVIGGGDWAADRIVADCIRAWITGSAVQIRSPQATRPWQHVLEPLSGYLLLGARSLKDPTFQGESYNFGPRGEQNATVLELLEALAAAWGFEKPSESYQVVNEIPFHEAGLLKLNVDKALLTLRWTPTLSYDECVGMTGGWYRDVAQRGDDAMTVTMAQIKRYETLAAERQLVWAR